MSDSGRGGGDKSPRAKPTAPGAAVPGEEAERKSIFGTKARGCEKITCATLLRCGESSKTEFVKVTEKRREQ